MNKTVEILKRLYTCSPAILWVGLPENEGKSHEELWDSCETAGWLLWLADKTGVDRNLLTLAACDCARLALPFLPDGEDRPRLCIEAAEAYTRGEVTIEEVKPAATALWNVDKDDHADEHTASFYAVCTAARVAAVTLDPNYRSAVYAVSARAAEATEEAAFADYVVSARNAGTRVNSTCARTARNNARSGCVRAIRARIPWSMVEAALKLKGMCG